LVSTFKFQFSSKIMVISIEMFRFPSIFPPLYFSKRQSITDLTEMVLSTPEYRSIQQIAHSGINILTKFKIS
jgi:hypothetical protein